LAAGIQKPENINNLRLIQRIRLNHCRKSRPKIYPTHEQKKRPQKEGRRKKRRAILGLLYTRKKNTTTQKKKTAPDSEQKGSRRSNLPVESGVENGRHLISDRIATETSARYTNHEEPTTEK